MLERFSEISTNYAYQEYVVPKSIPMTVPISSLAPFDIEAARKAITPNIMYLMFVFY